MSLVTEIVNVVQPQAGSDVLRGWIDLPVAGATIYGESLEVEGWVVGADSPARAVEAVVEGSLVQRAPVDIFRPDVTAACPGLADGRIGFSLTLERPRTAAFELHLRVVHADESRRPLGVIQACHSTRDLPSDRPLVSVVIPCHNQAPFIADAIQSVLAQTYRTFELVAVDDGSVDGSAEIVGDFGIRCVRQERMGPAGARNGGFRSTTGEYVVFLDGDNRLVPHALEANLHAFGDHPESAFVGGRYAYIDESGARLRSNRLPNPRTPNDHYAALLAENYFGSPDNVMFRRAVLDVAGLFDSAVDGLEDYDLYLRIAKEYPVYYHVVTISEYRVHDNQFSRDQAMMLRSAVRVLRRQKPARKANPRLREAYRRGLAHWRSAFGKSLDNQLRTALRQRRWSEAMRTAATLLRWYPAGLLPLLADRITSRAARRRPGGR